MSVELEEIIIDNIEIDITKFKKIFDQRQLKAYIFCEYKNNRFSIRKEIELKEPRVQNNQYIIKLSPKVILGKGTIENNKITNLEIYNGDDYSILPSSLFAINDANQNTQEDAIEKYMNGVFKIHYDYIKYIFKNFSKIKPKYNLNKAKAMASYLAIRDYIQANYKEKCKVSESNVFLKNIGIEYDFLLLKPQVETNKGIYDPSDVYATVEVKTSGYIADKGQDITKDFKKYLKKEYSGLVPHLYVALHEASVKNSNSRNYYKSTASVLKNSKKCHGIIITVKSGSKKYIVPNDFDFDIIIDNIINESCQRK